MHLPCGPQHTEDDLETTSGFSLPFTYLSMLLIQQTFHDNIMPGSVNEPHVEFMPISRFTLHPRTELEELDILKSLGKLP